MLDLESWSDAGVKTHTQFMNILSWQGPTRSSGVGLQGKFFTVAFHNKVYSRAVAYSFRDFSSENKAIKQYLESTIPLQIRDQHKEQEQLLKLFMNSTSTCVCVCSSSPAAPNPKQQQQLSPGHSLAIPSTYLGVSGLKAAGPPSKLRPVFGLFWACLDNMAVPDPRGTESEEITAESM